jgi:predicted phage replisome organizer
MMAEVKWIKLCTDVFDDEKILLIESMPEADSIIVIWFKLLCLAGKQNNGGVFALNDKIFYTDEMLAAIFRRPINVVRLALSTFDSFGMVEIINNVYTIPNWEKHQNIDGMEKIKEQNRERKRLQRARQKQSLLGESRDRHVTSHGCHDIEEEIEEDKEKEFHSSILSREEAELKFMGGTLGQGVVLLSQEQFDDLCDKLSIDELEKYIGIVAECELKGKSFKKKSHYQAILDMVAKDRRVAKKKASKPTSYGAAYDLDLFQKTLDSK